MTATTRDDAVADSSSAAPWLVAGASAAAGLIHLSVVSEHNAGDIIVPIGFAATAIAQIGVAVALVARRASRAAIWAAIVINVLATGAWAWSRTVGLPWEPYNGFAEQASTLDLTSAGLQAAAITLGVGMLIAPRAVKIPPAVSAAFAIGAVALAAVVVVTPEDTSGAVTVAASSAGGAAAAMPAGDGHGHSHGGTAATPAAAGDMAAEMLRIDRARCDLAFNPQAYWDEAYAMNVDTYGGGSMSMAAPSTLTDVAAPQLLDGAGSAHLDEMISLTTISSGEGAAAQLIGKLVEATDEEYEAWRRWVAANPGGGHAEPTVDANGRVEVVPPSMGHPGPSTWKAMVDTAQCDRLAAELATAREVTERFPTVADATEAGYFRVTGYVPGIAAHYMKFDIVDSEFHLEEPEMLLFDGTDPDSRIVGLSYYVRQDGTAEPTQGFVGDNDHYHRHFGLCIGAGGVIGDSTTTEEECAARGGRKGSGMDGWMSHAWVVPGCESPWGVFSGENPLLDSAMGDASGDADSGGCAASEARDRYDLSPGASDLSVTAPTDEASGR
jgi:hypothetical protein